jgi:hypothetical protein
MVDDVADALAGGADRVERDGGGGWGGHFRQPKKFAGTGKRGFDSAQGV